MNKVVIREMLATELPEAVRGDIASDHRVEVIVRDLADDGPQLAGHFSQHFGKIRPTFTSTADILDHVRRIRDGEG